MTEMTMTPEAATALRRPFPPESVGKLPKAGMMLDYVGHAAITDRLLTVDPNWSWAPFALDANGLPALDGKGNLWIRLTICGVTRIGVGDGKNAKELIGDALRNAAMRFGVALDLWAKENLVEFAQAAAQTPGSDAATPPPPTSEPGITKAQLTALNAAVSELGLSREQKLAGVAAVIGREVASTKELSKGEASAVIDRLVAKLGVAEVVDAEVVDGGEDA